MRHALITIVASFVGVMAALFAFYSWRDAEDARTRAAVETEQQAKLEQGRQLRERTLGEERALSAIVNDIAAVSGTRVAIAEFYMRNGRMPASNAEAGLPEPSTYKGQSLLSLQVAEGGTILLTFDATSGVEGGVIEWQPDLGGIESMGMQWRCLTHDYPLIVRALPSCTYVPAGEVEIAPGKSDLAVTATGPGRIQ